MRSWSIPAGHLFGVEFRINWTFLFLLVFVWVTLPGQTHSPAASLRGAALVGIIFLCVVLHELGHALAGIGSGITAKAIILLPIGGVTLFDESRQVTHPGPATWKREIWIALGGPAINLLAAAVAAAIIAAAVPQARIWDKPYIHFNNLPRTLVWCNVGLALLNLMPGYPLDGGRVLRAIFSRRTDPVRATRRAVAIGQTLATVLMFTGMVQYLQAGNPESTWLTMLGFFLFVAAQLEERSAVFQSVLESVHLEDVMLTEFAILSPADTLEDALEKAVHTLQDDFPVIRSGDMVGTVSRQKILQALRSEGNGYVQSVMNRMFEVAQKKESLASAFRKLTAKNLSLIPVVEDQRLVGIITLQNLMHSMALLAESRKLRRASLG
ncbi:MAG TPA: site-2 protease family protein [Terriglobales bacterium]|jgi:Zn-dependent protease